MNSLEYNRQNILNNPSFDHTTVKPVLSDHSKIDKTHIFMKNGSLMKIESIAECSPRGAFCNTFDPHEAIIGLENQFLVSVLSGRLRQIYCIIIV